MTRDRFLLLRTFYLWSVICLSMNLENGKAVLRQGSVVNHLTIERDNAPKVPHT